MKHEHFRNAVIISLVIIAAALILSSILHAQTNRPPTSQFNCTGTAPVGTIFGFLAVSAVGASGNVGLQPFRCIQLDPKVFTIDGAGQLTIKTPAPIAGTACNPPLSGSLDGAIIYAQMPDKSCLPLVAVADPAVLQGFSGAFQTLFVKIPGGTVSPIPAR